MASSERLEGMPDVISGGSGREWPVWTPRRVRVAAIATALLALAATALGGYLAGERRPDSPPATGRGAAESAAVAKLDIPGGRPSGARLAYGSIWVTTWDGHVVRVDPETREIGDPIPVGEGPLATKEGFGSVWVTSAYEGTVTRIADAISYQAFPESFCKFVRENHVQTDSHWMTSEIEENGFAEDAVLKF